MALLATVAFLAVLPYAAGVVLPYYVNDLHHLPLQEVASGRPDPKDLWPGTGGFAGFVQLAGFLSVGLTPILLLVALAGTGTCLTPWHPRTSRVVTAGLAFVALVCTGALAFFFSPMGNALVTWRMD